VAGLALGVARLPAWAAGPTNQPEIGVCTGLAKWDLMRKAGCTYVEENVGKFLSPNTPDAEFAEIAKKYKAQNVPVRACNGFLPAELKLVGPAPRHDDAVTYATKALQRAKLLGLECIVLGSGGARGVPEGFSKSEAEEQFVQVVRRIGKAAEASGVYVAMESLNSSETNFGNTLRDCLRMIKAVDSQRVCLTADMYHMLYENEGPDAIIEAGPRIVHCHVAEKAGRTAPGVSGQDFRPYLRALKQIGFKGGISLECRWKDFDAEVGPAVAAFKKQVSEIFLS